MEQVAGYIPDPVLRLRFLRAATSVARPSRRGLRRLCLVALAALCTALVVLIPLVLLSRLHGAAPPRNPPVLRRSAVPVAATVLHSGADVWLVERTGESETYSNGLRIDNRFLVSTHRRSYLAFPAGGRQPVQRTGPAGIVFHTTESQQAPFEAKENRVLRRIGESLLEYVSRRQAYNFVIDRFGRVYRVVDEEEAANHSGYSAWADEQWLYVNLNESFLGISFEAVSPPVQEEAALSPAQARSAATLVEMLRHRYRIPASNCVTHAQVSVNPENMHVGLHVDWASGFPFEAAGLPDNYTAPLPSLWAYGFDYDPSFTSRVGDGMRTGIDAAETILAERAAAAGLRPAEYKKRLRQRYREMLAEVRRARPDGDHPE